MQSPSSRRAWIEIALDLSIRVREAVALLAEGVDRNLASSGMNDVDEVALLAEGVDRNALDAVNGMRRVVALLAEGVDRNV